MSLRLERATVVFCIPAGAKDIGGRVGIRRRRKIEYDTTLLTAVLADIDPACPAGLRSQPRSSWRNYFNLYGSAIQIFGTGVGKCVIDSYCAVVVAELRVAYSPVELVIGEHARASKQYRKGSHTKH